MAGIVVDDDEDAKRRGLHCGVGSLLIAFVFLGVKKLVIDMKIKMKICKGRNKIWKEVSIKVGN